jgi:hypothetical protein
MPGRISKHSFAVELGRAETKHVRTLSTMMSRCICCWTAVSGQVAARWSGANWNASPEVVSLAATTTKSSLA